MAVWTVTCAGCGVSFEAKSPRARWHSPACKKAMQRAGRATPTEVAEAPAEPGDAQPSGLVASVREELERHDALGSFSGQLALQLATRLANPDESGISSLSKELRTVMAAALDGRTPPPGDGAPAPTPQPDGDDDEVTSARRRREEARQAAGLA